MRVLERQFLAPHTGEMDGHEHVLALALDPDQEPLAPARVAEPGSDPVGQILIDLPLVPPHPTLSPKGERMTPSAGCVEEGELLFGNFQEKARRLAEAVAMEPPV